MGQRSTKDFEEIMNEVLELNPGWRVEDTSKGVKFVGPETQQVFAHRTHSDYRAVRNLRAELRRAGAVVRYANGQLPAGAKTPKATPQKPAQRANLRAVVDVPRTTGRPTLTYEKPKTDREEETMTANKSGGTRGRNTFIDKVLLVVKQKPNEHLIIDELMTALPGLTRNQIQQAMYRLATVHGVPIDTVTQGRVWVYHGVVPEVAAPEPESESDESDEPGEPAPKLEKLVKDTAKSVFTKVYEEVRSFGNGEILLRDDEGHVYVATLERLDGRS